MKYHPAIEKLDSAASDFHALNLLGEKENCFRIAGRLQQTLLVSSPYPRTRRFLSAQWAWALGHLGLLHQLIRLFRKREPQTQIVLEARGSANNYFLEALSPFLLITPELPKEVEDEAMRNAVYFGCPDGVHSLAEFNKMIERECADEPQLLHLSDSQRQSIDGVIDTLGIQRPFVALQARRLGNEPERNITEEQIEEALAPYKAQGFSVVSTGLDDHPIRKRYPFVDDPLKSFLLSAGCDQFIGSNSGAWTIAHAYRRPVEIMNDYARSAWIYA